MILLEHLVSAALRKDALLLRGLCQEWLREKPRLEQCPPPATENPLHLAIAAGLIELLADHTHQSPPAWTAQVGPLDDEVFLVNSVATMPRLRELCRNESPLPLRCRRLYAPPNFLQFA